MIKKLVGLSGGAIDQVDVTNYRFNRSMQAIIDPSQDAGALDSSQSWFLECIDTGTEWRVLYTGANTQTINYFGQNYINNDATFMAIKTKSNNVLDGWEKVRDVNGDPMPLFKPSFVNDRFDEWQVWIRAVIVEGSTWKAWFIGDSGFAGAFAAFTYRVGYATSIDEGITWTKLGTTPIYTDLLTGGGRGIVTLRVVYNEDTAKYVMFYGGIDMNVTGFFVAQSDDGITGWVKTHSNILAARDYLAPSDFRYIDGTYYLWAQFKNRMTAGNLGPTADIILLSSTDLTTWTHLGTQMTIRGSQEFGIGNHVKCMQKPNGEWFALYTYYINRTQAFDALNNTKEPSPATKIAESNNSASFIMNSSCTFQYPDYVTFHAPLGFSIPFVDVINNTSGVLSTGTPGWTERDHLKLTAGQKVTFPNPGINGAHFGVKMRIEIKTGTLELFRIGNDVLVTLETLKVRVRLSSDGLTYQKDWITNINFAKPTGLDYIDNHIYLIWMWDGTTLHIWNGDGVEKFTAGQITKTVDNALTVVNNSGADIVLCDNSSIEFRSVSICDAPTELEIQQLNI
jgi:hypothetical protein